MNSINGERKNSRYLHRDAKLGSDEEDESLLIRIGSMVAASSAPTGGGTVEGLAEEARPPMFAARRRALRKRAEEEEGKCGRGGKASAFPPIYSEIGRRFGSDAPTISTSRDGNGCTTCPTSCCGSFDPIYCHNHLRGMRGGGVRGRDPLKYLTDATVGGPEVMRVTNSQGQIRRKFKRQWW